MSQTPGFEFGAAAPEGGALLSRPKGAGKGDRKSVV